jgi:hypothetical protein
MMYVARAALSRALSVSPWETRESSLAVLPFVFVAAPAFVDREAVGFGLGGCDSASGRRSSLSVTTVAGVQVAVDATVALTASTLACKEAISMMNCLRPDR